MLWQTKKCNGYHRLRVAPGVSNLVIGYYNTIMEITALNVMLVVYQKQEKNLLNTKPPSPLLM
jgi:hypothetical protein